MGFEALEASPAQLFAQRQANQLAPITPTTPDKSDKTRSGTVAFLVSLTDELQAEIEALYKSYMRTGNVPSLGTLRLKLVRRYIHVIAPTTPDLAALVASEFELFLEGSDAELLGNYSGYGKLPKRGAKAPKTCDAIARITVNLDQALLQRVRERTRSVQPKPTPTPTLTQSLTDDQLDVGSALQWIWDLLKGDFNENPTVAQTIIRSLLGLIPGVDQAFDLVDLSANLIALTYHRRYDEFEPWFNLVLTLVGAIPEVGSVIKGVGKLARRGAAALPLDEIVGVLGKLDLLEGASRMRGLLDSFLGAFDTHATKALERASAILQKQAELLESVKATAGWFSASAKRYIENLIAGTRGALARAAQKMKAAFEYLAARFRDLLQAIEQRIAKLTRKDDESVDTRSVKETSKPTKPTTPKTTKPKPTATKTSTKTSTKTDSTKTDSTKTDPTKTESTKTDSDTQKTVTISPPPPEMADLVTNGIARKGEAWGNNALEGSCAHVAMRNAISATLQGRETYVALVSGLTEYGRLLVRFGLDPNGSIAKLMNRLGIKTAGGHAIAAVKGEDGIWRYISWGSVELDINTFMTKQWGNTTTLDAIFTLDQHVKWMTENLTKHFEPRGTSPMLAEVQKEAREMIGWIAE